MGATFLSYQSRDYGRQLATIKNMVGGIAIAVILLLSPFMITLSLAGVAALLGNSLKDDAESRHEGSSLVETNY